MIYLGEAGHGRHIVSLDYGEVQGMYEESIGNTGTHVFPQSGEIFPRFAPPVVYTAKDVARLLKELSDAVGHEWGHIERADDLYDRVERCVNAVLPFNSSV